MFVCFTEKLEFHTVSLSWSTKVSVSRWLPVGTQVAVVSGHCVISLDTMKLCSVFLRLSEETGFCWDITKLVTAHRGR